MVLSNSELIGMIGEYLREKRRTLSVAESCTGGLVGALLTSLPGSSDWFAGGVIAYSDSVKIRLLDVPEDYLKRYGAVSEEVVCRMISGVRKLFETDYAVAVSGIAGPEGGTSLKPVGTVWMSVGSGSSCISEKAVFSGNRETIRTESASHLLSMLQSMISEEII